MAGKILSSQADNKREQQSKDFEKHKVLGSIMSKYKRRDVGFLPALSAKRINSALKRDGSSRSLGRDRPRVLKTSSSPLESELIAERPKKANKSKRKQLEKKRMSL